MSIRLIVGLGNPGPEYEQTRHNAGFWFVDNLENASQGGRWQKEARFSAFVAKTKINGNDVWLLKPQTFMNRSGLLAFAYRSGSSQKPESEVSRHRLRASASPA